MAKEPEEAGQPASGKPVPPGDNANSSATPGSTQPPEAAKPASPAPSDSASIALPDADGTGAAASGDSPPEHSPLPAAGDALANPASGHSDEHVQAELGQSPGESESHGHGHQEEWRDPAYDEYHHHDDPHHYDAHHGEHSHHTTGEHSHEPGAAEGGGGSSTGKEEEKTFEGLFGGGDDDGEGGPVKGFLDHLEDLRWVLIKCMATILVAMVVCLVATPLIVKILMRPVNTQIVFGHETQPTTLRLRIGTNQVELAFATNQFGFINLNTNGVTTYDLVPIMVDTNMVLALRPDLTATTNATPHKPLINIRSVPIAFSIAIQIALWGGIGLASPFIMFFLGQFLVPALKKKERDYVYKGVSIGAGLFFVGVAFCYFVLLPVGVMATVQFANWMGFASEIWDAGEYISFCVMFMVGMGLCFELPVLLLTLVKIGILNYRLLNKFRPIWLIINLILSGFITPSGDPLSMLLMAAPIHLLYEISVLIAWYWDWSDRRRAAKES